MNTLRRVLTLLLPVAAGVLAVRPAAAQITLLPVVAGVSDPVAITHAGDGSGRLFVTDQNGYIWIVKAGAVLPTPFLDIHTRVDAGGERGLLSVAFHPAYASNGRFFVYYTDKTGTIVIAEYHVSSSDPDQGDASSEIPLLSIPHPSFSNHNGGQLQFGPDGYLYAGTGDGGSGGDPFGNGQNLDVLLGKILRLDVNGGSLIPASNPFVDGLTSTRDEIWAYGLRNPWRFSFDRATGDLWIGDVGQGCWEEVDRQPASSNGGENYGWNVMEGGKCYSPPTCNPPPTCVDPSFKMPVLTYSHTDPADCSVTGGYMYRGLGIPGLAGTYVYADYCSGKIFGGTNAGGSWNASLLTDTPFFVTTFGEDESGELYLADATTGTIYRLGAAGATGFMDDFEDGDASDWNVIRGAWSVAGGSLTNGPAKKAEILAPFAGCTLCTVTATVRIATAGGSVSLLAFRESAESYVEVRLSDKDDTLLFKRVRKGKVTAKQKVAWAVTPGADTELEVAYDGAQLTLTVDDAGAPDIVLDQTGNAAPFGNVGFLVKGPGKGKVSGLFEEISVN